MRAVQHFADEYLDRCRALTADQIARFLEDFRVVHGARQADAASDSKTGAGSGAARTRRSASRVGQS